MTTFYVASTGNDSNDGLTPTTPWLTITKVRAALAATTIALGDVVQFRRGDTFYGSNITPPTPASRDGVSRITFGAYGAGTRPIIDAAKTLNTSGNWTLHATGVWKHPLTNTALFGGNKENTSPNVGFLKTDGVIRGVKKFTLGALVDPWDFYNDTTHVYVKATANPTTLASDILVAVEGHVFPLTHRVNIFGLHLRHSGSHGVRGTAANVDIVGNEIETCGGSELAVLPGIRYGNGIEAWVGSADWKVEHNESHDCYDAGFTIQGATTNNAEGNKWARIHARYNRFYNNSWDCEVFSQLTNPAHVGVGNEGGFIDCSFEDNECLTAGGSWTPDVRVGRDAALVMYELELPAAFSYRRNVIYNPGDGWIYSNSEGDPGHPDTDPNFVIDDNEVHLAPTVRLIWNHSGWDLVTFQAAYNAQTLGRHYTITDPTDSTREALAYLASISGSARATEKAGAKGSAETAGRLGITGARLAKVESMVGVVTWAAVTAYEPGKLVRLPTGGLGYAATARTSGASWDATERDAWTFLAGGHMEVISSGTTTWKCPTGITKILALDLLAGAAGGAGGGSSTGAINQTGGVGGAAGERVIHRNLTVTPATSYTCQVGTGSAGGAGGAAGGNNAGTAASVGGNTFLNIGATSYKANGGRGGSATPGNSTASISAGVAGGMNNGYAAGVPGGGGIATQSFGNAPIPLNGVVGGGAGGPANSTLGGLGGAARTGVGDIVGQITPGTSATAAGGNGAAATQLGCGGGGGGGGCNGSAGGNGGAGADGQMVIEF